MNKEDKALLIGWILFGITLPTGFIIHLPVTLVAVPFFIYYSVKSFFLRIRKRRSA